MLLVCSFTGAQVEASEDAAEKLLNSGSFSLPTDAEKQAETKPKTRITRKATK